MKTLVLAEKPSVGRDIARVLHCPQKADGYLEGKEYVVTWGLGHLIELQDPEGYNKKYKDWKMEDLPIMPEKLETVVIAKTGKQYRTVQGLLNRKDVTDVVIATDAGREGELVARWILKQANCRKKCRRLWISSVTDKAIREGFAHLKDAKEYDHLYEAAVSRAEADWLVGINGTRALTCKYNAQLSCGRVQTPTLAMIAEREEEIRKFQPQSYYTIQVQADAHVSGTGLKSGTGNAQRIRFQWRDASGGSTRTFSRERAEDVCRQAQNGTLVITKVDRKRKKTEAPMLYDLTELQREGNRRFGYSAKETLNIMQRLYENHKVLTYPRTDSRYLTSDIVPTLRERIDSCGIGPYKGIAAKVKNRNFSGRLPFVNNEKVSDHHAIIPTEEVPELSHMTIDERRIYDLVVRRFLAVMYPPFEYEETVLTANLEDTAGQKNQTTEQGSQTGKNAKSGQGSQITFAARGKVVLAPGWKEVYGELGESEDEDQPEEELQEQILPMVQQGQRLRVIAAASREGKTKPPARFREATLLSAMENPVRYLASSDRQRAKTLTETGGLGTVATRADIIDKLFGSFLMEKRGQEIYLTAKGRQLLGLVPEDLRRPELTADWEMKLARIASGNIRRESFMQEIRTYTREILQEIQTQDGTYRHENMTNKTCPNCGKRLLAVNGKNAKMLVCQDRSCGYRETVSRTSNARCPVCHKKMELSGSGDAATFFCVCGHREKLEKFKERRQKEGAGVTKRDVAAYMRKQEKDAEGPINNAMAAALAGIRLDNKK
jgi:DNA topoisomerase-3